MKWQIEWYDIDEIAGQIQLSSKYYDGVERTAFVEFDVIQGEYDPRTYDQVIEKDGLKIGFCPVAEDDAKDWKGVPKYILNQICQGRKKDDVKKKAEQNALPFPVF